MTKQTKQVELPEELELSKKITNLIKLARNGYFGTENYNELMETLLRLDTLIGYIKQDKTQAQQEAVERERERILGEIRYCYYKIENPEADRMVYASEALQQEQE